VPLSHRLRALPLLGPALAMALVIAAFSAGAAEALPAPGVRCTDWAAAESAQPFERARLIVTAECVVPTASHKLELRPSSPQGINPRILLLDLVVHPPKEPTLPVLTRVHLRYEQKTSPGFINAVTIMPDGPTLPVKGVW
jgi:hypothetical protein